MVDTDALANQFTTVSPFDEKLAEDRKVNRLEDSYLLWRSVCACKLLSRTQIILCMSVIGNSVLSWYTLLLVLNKCDLLQAKLQRGVRIRDSVPSFGDRKNDLPTATRCMSRMGFYSHLNLLKALRFSDFQQHFKEISRNSSPTQRTFYVHLTSVIVSDPVSSLRFNSDVYIVTGHSLNGCNTGSRSAIVPASFSRVILAETWYDSLL